MSARLEVYVRPDGRFDWRLWTNGRIVGTSGTQGYNDRRRARQMGERVVGGWYDFVIDG